MGFDLYVQGFLNGDAAPLDGEIVRRVASGFEVRERVNGPEAPGWSLSINRPRPADLAVVAQLIVEADAVAYWPPAAILTACVAHADKAADMPPAFQRLVVIRTGEDIERAIHADDDTPSTAGRPA